MKLDSTLHEGHHYSLLINKTTPEHYKEGNIIYSTTHSPSPLWLSLFTNSDLKEDEYTNEYEYYNDHLDEDDENFLSSYDLEEYTIPYFCASAEQTLKTLQMRRTTFERVLPDSGVTALNILEDTISRLEGFIMLDCHDLFFCHDLNTSYLHDSLEHIYDIDKSKECRNPSFYIGTVPSHRERIYSALWSDCFRSNDCSGNMCLYNYTFGSAWFPVGSKEIELKKLSRPKPTPRPIKYVK